MRRAAVACGLLALSLLLGMSVRGGAPPAKVSYMTQIQPLFEKQCLGCHSGPQAGGGYQMTARDLLLKGGRHGVAAVPGKGAKSLLVQYLTGDAQPRMPSGGPPLDRDTIRLIERWIDEGARFDRAVLPKAKTDTSTTAGVAPAVGKVSAPATCVAFSPDGKLLAVGGWRAVRLLDATTGKIVRTIPGAVSQVLSVAWIGNEQLAVGGGAPGVSGEVLIADMASGKILRRFGGKEHADVVTCLAWRPGTRTVATGSLDKTVRIWNADSGQCARTIKEQADAVFAVAYSPDRKRLVSGSADRTAKVMSADTGKVEVTLAAHGDSVDGLAFNRDGTFLATASADKTVRLWKMEAGKMQNPERTLFEGDAITGCAFSADNNRFVYGAANHQVKFFNGDGTQHQKTMAEPQDWVYCVSVSPDSRTVAAGAQDGNVYLWNAADGKLITSVRLTAKPAQGVNRK